MHVHKTSTDMTTTSRLACSKCGTIGKSGKASCCGRGGSWFRKCGSTGNREFPHTWSEGILACKIRAQWKAVRSRRPNGAQHLNSSYDIRIGNSKVSHITFTKYITGVMHSIAATNSTNHSITAPDNGPIITTLAHTTTTSRSTDILPTAPAYIGTFSTIVTEPITSVIASTTAFTRTAKVSADWISQGMC